MDLTTHLFGLFSPHCRSFSFACMSLFLFHIHCSSPPSFIAYQHDDSTLKSKCCLKLGEWQQTLAGEGKESMVHVLNSFHLATQVCDARVCVCVCACDHRDAELVVLERTNGGMVGLF